jgi:hypothetical protein
MISSLHFELETGVPQFHSQNRKYFGDLSQVNIIQTVDGTVVIEREDSVFLT